MGQQVLLNQALRSIILKNSSENVEHYERELAAAEAERKKALAEFKANGAAKIKALKEQIKELSAQIKTASPAQKAELGKQIKQLNAQIEENKTPPVNRFAYLESDIKAYAGSMLLFKPMLNPEVLAQYGISFDYNEEERLVLDAEELRDSELGNKIRESADYIFGRARDLNEKITQASDVRNIIMMDAKRLLDQEPETIDFALIEKCHTAFEAEKAAIERKNKDIERRREESRTGIKVIKEYPDGYLIVEMLPSPVYDENGNLRYHTSLKYESDEMGHCVGRGGYNQFIGKEGWHFYSLRGPDDNGVLVPHCTISIENEKLSQIKGNSNLAVKIRYLYDVRDFITSLNMPVPDSEKERIGYVKDERKTEVDLFNLPTHTRLPALTFASGDYKGIKLENIDYIGSFKLEGQVNVNDFRAAAKIKEIGTFTIDTEEKSACYNESPLHAKHIVVKEKAALPRYLGDIEELTYDSSVPLNFTRNWEKIKKITLRSPLNLSVAELPTLAEGICGGEWGDAGNISVKELLEKMYGTVWVSKHLTEQNGKIIINTDLDLSGRGLARLPDDMTKVVIHGTLDLSNNKLDDISRPCTYPVCRKMIINDTFADYNPDRYKTLPYLPEGIDYNTNFTEVIVRDCDIADVVKKFNIADKDKITFENGRVIVDDDYNMDSIALFKRNNIPYNIENMEVRQTLILPDYTIKHPTSRKLSLPSFPLLPEVTFPDDTEEVIIKSYLTLLPKLNGKNLKRITCNGENRIPCNNLKSFVPGVEYKGNFWLTPVASSTPEDYSDIVINGKLTVTMQQLTDNIIRLPQCTEVIFNEAMREKDIFILHPDTEKLTCPNSFDIDLLPPESKIKYVSCNLSPYDSESMEFIKRLSQRGIIYDGSCDIGFKEDLSDCLIRSVRTYFNHSFSDISKFPQCENLSICGTDYNFDSKFLKDASPLLKDLELSYIETNAADYASVDFTVLPPATALEKLSLSVTKIQNNLLDILPKTLTEIKLFRCNGILDLEPLNRLPALKNLEINSIKLSENALDKINPERLETLSITGDSKIKMRAQEIVAIHQLPPSIQNNKIKQMHQWLVSDDSKTPYPVKQIVFYTTVNDILNGKHPQDISKEEIAARVTGVKNYMLDSCAKIIMAEERNHTAGNETAGRAVLVENKGKKPGFYNHFRNYYSPDLNLRKAGQMAKSIITRSIKHHPDFEKAQWLTTVRMRSHITELQINFNRLLAAQHCKLSAYKGINNSCKHSFNHTVRKLHDYKSMN